MKRLGIVLIATALALWSSARAIVHAVDRALLDGSAFVHALAPQFHGSGERELVINGAVLRVESGRAQGSLAAWLRAARSECEAGGSWQLPMPPRAPERSFIVEARGEDSALVGCLVGTRVELDAPWLVALVRALRADLDLGRLGELRVMRARRQGAGLHVVRARSAGPLPLARMFPRAGDAPGLDLPGIPRPATGRRVLAAYQRGAAPGLAVYRTHGSASTLLEDESAQLVRAGFAVLGSERSGQRAFQRGPELLLVSSRQAGEHALIALLSPGLGPLAVEVAPALRSTQPAAAGADNRAR